MVLPVLTKSGMGSTLAPLKTSIMKRLLRSNNPGLRFLLQFWQKHCDLEDWHHNWARQSIRVHSKIRAGSALYYEGEKQKNIYLVADGMLARVGHHQRGNRLIYAVATSGMAMMTTAHPHSHTPGKGDILALRSNTLSWRYPIVPYWISKCMTRILAPLSIYFSLKRKNT